jgi:hypothetical protein
MYSDLPSVLPRTKSSALSRITTKIPVGASQQSGPFAATNSCMDN